MCPRLHTDKTNTTRWGLKPLNNTGLNFLDIVASLGEVPSAHLGQEVVGIVTEVGSSVTDVKPGETGKYGRFLKTIPRFFGSSLILHSFFLSLSGKWSRPLSRVSVVTLE